MRRLAALGGSLALLATVTTACTEDAAEDSADQAVADLATALSAKSLDGVTFDDQAGEQAEGQGDQAGDGAATPAEEYADIVALLEDLPVEVAAGKVDTGDGEATGTLHWTWDVAGHEWSYDTEVSLTGSGEDWAVSWSPTIIEGSLEAGETLDVDTLLARRGDITGAGGDPIVTLRDVVRFGLDKTKTKPGQVASSARAIAQQLDVDVASFVKQAKGSGPKAFVEAIVLREADARRVGPSYNEIPGAVRIGTQRPLAPSRAFAAPLLGSVGQATAEIIEESDGRVVAGDQVGLSGLQARYDEQLAGTSGVEIEAVDADGNERELFSADPVDGKPLALTLDVDLQAAAEEILADTVPASAIVAIRPSNGNILAAASGPGSKGLNTATFGQYAPGSTFKVVTALALLRSGLESSSQVECPSTVVVDGKSFKNYDDYPPGSLGRITLREAIAQSCNTALIGEHERLDDGALADAAAALGLGVDHDLGFPAYFGQVPPPSGETEKAADMIGQGKVLASPMAMATVAASVRSGTTVLPRLVAEHDVEQVEPSVPLTRAEARQLQGLMRAVVTEGSGRFLQGLPGEIGAKTGTAEYGTPKGGSLPTHTWMIAARDDLAVAVFVETGQSGSSTAGPLLEEFLGR